MVRGKFIALNAETRKNDFSSSWMQSQKWQNDLCCFQGKPFNIKVIQVYDPTSNTEEAEVERFYEELQDLLELTPPPKKKKKN